MICQRTIKIAMGVGMVLCASASFAEVKDSFENSAHASGVVWVGDGGSFSNETLSASDVSAVGFPITNADHDVVFFVEGSVICSNETTTATSSVSDFLIYIPELSDELGTDEELAGAKVAIAAGTELSNNKIPLMLYCTNNNDAAWVQIATVESNTWLRVTLAFENNRCRVSLDGEPVVNAFGYAASSGNTTGGPWYNLASTGNNSVQSLSFIGCAKLDDVVIKDSFEENAFPATAVATLDSTVTGGETETVSYNNLNKWGMTVSDVTNKWNTVLNETSGMTVGQKIACGYDPNSATKFVPVSITKTEADKATIKFPIESTAELGRYKVVLEGGTADGGKTEVDGASDAGEGLAAINLTDLKYNTGSNVIKFTLKAQP